MAYYCPRCKKELRKGELPGLIKWTVGPLFGQLLSPLECIHHGPVDNEDLTQEEQKRIRRNKWIGIFAGITFNIVIIILIIVAYRMELF